MENHSYEVQLKWNNDRIGTVSSPALNQSIQVATPPEFPKGVAGIWSPEHFLVAAVNSCLMTTFLAIAENSKLEFVDFNSSAIGTLEMVDGKYMISKIVLKPIIMITNELHKEKAERILHKAENACLISNSLKSEIIFEPTVLIPVSYEN